MQESKQEVTKVVSLVKHGGKNYYMYPGPEVTRIVQKVLSLIGFLCFIPGIFYNASLHLNGVLNS